MRFPRRRKSALIDGPATPPAAPLEPWRVYDPGEANQEIAVKRRHFLVAVLGTAFTVPARAQQPPDVRIDFAPNVTDTPDSATPALDEVARALGRQPGIYIGVIGSRDAGEAAQTGWERAHSVRVHLIARHGVSIVRTTELADREEMIDGPYVRIIFRRQIPVPWHLRDNV